VERRPPSLDHGRHQAALRCFEVIEGLRQELQRRATCTRWSRAAQLGRVRRTAQRQRYRQRKRHRFPRRRGDRRRAMPYSTSSPCPTRFIQSVVQAGDNTVSTRPLTPSESSVNATRGGSCPSPDNRTYFGAACVTTTSGTRHSCAELPDPRCRDRHDRGTRIRALPRNPADDRVTRSCGHASAPR